MGLLAFSAWSFTPTVDEARRDAELAAKRMTVRESAERIHRLNSGRVPKVENEIKDGKDVNFGYGEFPQTLDDDIEVGRLF